MQIFPFFYDDCQFLQIKPGCSIIEFLSQAGLTPPTTSTEATSSLLASPSPQKEEWGGACIRRRHILVGLHTCGDLGATMMRVFKESEEIAGLVSLGCCYMKLSSPLQQDGNNSSNHSPPPSSVDSAPLGYPLSDFVCSLLPGSSLSYEAREVACHSIDSYSSQLQQGTHNISDFISLVCSQDLIIGYNYTVKRRFYVRDRFYANLSK